MSAAPEAVEAEVVEPDLNVAALAVRDEPGGLVTPAASIADVEQAFRDYSTLCESLLTDDDYQKIGDRRFRKRSAWRKLAVAFAVTFEIVDRQIIRDGPHVVSAEFVVRAMARNGRYADGWGSCDVFERCCPRPCPKASWNRHDCCPPDCLGSVHFSHANHDVPATGETRAKNRAAADLFGMGEVSAEEVSSQQGSQPDAGQYPPDRYPGDDQDRPGARKGNATDKQVEAIGKMLKRLPRGQATEIQRKAFEAYAVAGWGELSKSGASAVIDRLGKVLDERKVEKEAEEQAKIAEAEGGS